MKKGILLLLLISSVFANAQSLKEALYGGKLKNKPGTVVRKGDDLTAQVDTTTQKLDTTNTSIAADSIKAKSDPLAMVDSAANGTVRKRDSAVAATNPARPNTSVAPGTVAPDTTTSGAITATSPDSTNTAAEDAANAPKTEAAPPKSNNAIWKEFVDSVASTIKTEVLSSKKIKRETYYISVAYTIETDGQVTVGDVSVSPENKLLQDQVKSRLNQDTPKLAPVVNSSGTARKVTRRYNFTITKE